MEDKEEKKQEFQPHLTKLEQDYMRKLKEDHKKNLTKKQIVAGREFKGIAFISKPDVILFKDFELGKVYRQKIVVTNVSFSFNSFKLLPITDAYKDFFDIIYSPSGKMSAGLSTNIEIVFTPKVNADIITVLPLLAETGPIDIPLQCFCRKAIVSPDKKELDFGSVIYGEEGKVKLVLTNSGALPVGFEIFSIDGKKLPLIKPTKLAPSQLAENLLKDQESALSPKEPKADSPPKTEVRMVEPEIEIKSEVKKVETSPGNSAKKPSENKKTEANKEPEIQETEEPKKDELKEIALKISGYDFLSQMDFHRIGKVEGYSSHTITFTFIPIALGSHKIQFLVKFDNEKHSPSFVIDLK